MADDGSVTIRVKLDAAGVEGGLDSIKRKTKEVGAEAERSGARSAKPLADVEAGTGRVSGALGRLKARARDASSGFGQLGSKGKGGLDMIASAARKAAAAFAAIKIGEAVKDFGKQALDSYAKYEQMVGGIDKLFGTGPAQTVEEYAETVGKSADKVRGEYAKLTKASQTVQDNAQKAYRTAGMSANAYMESVTGFSAALINSLGGDTQKAADMADVAMRSISDNANTFGTDSEQIVLTYQSLARGQYAMLDNLKLGYGGTKAELKRLVDDANKYAATHKKAAAEIGVGNRMQADSYSDVVAAIELIQQKQGIAGTTAREAATTIEGSVNSAKAAWENWVTELGKDDADIDARTKELVDSVATAAGNIVPRLAKIAGSAGDAIAEQLPKAKKRLMADLKRFDVGDAVKDLGKGAGSVADGIGDVLSSIDWGKAASDVIGGLASVIDDAADCIGDHGGEIAGQAVSVIGDVAEAIVKSAPTLLAAVGKLAVGVGSSIASAGIEAELQTKESLQRVLKSVSRVSDEVEESTKAWREQQDACTEAGLAAGDTYDHYEGLLRQLESVADSSGRVKKGHREEAETIVSVLNDALGANISIRDGVIQKYGEEKQKIEEVIAAKKAEALADAYQDQYQSALKGRAEALKNYADAQKAVRDAQEQYNESLKEYESYSGQTGYGAAEGRRVAEEALKKSKEAWDEAKGTLKTSKSTYTEMESTVKSYDKASSKLEKGSYGKAIDGFESLGRAAKHSAAEIEGMETSSEKLDALSENVTSYADQVGLAVGDTADIVKEKLEKSVVKLAKKGGDMSEALAEGIKDSSGEVQMSADEVRSALKEGLSAEDYLEAVGADKSSKFASGVGSGADAAGTAGEGVKAAAQAGLEGGDGAALQAGTSMGEGFGGGVGRGAGTASASGGSVAAAAEGGLKSNNGSASTWGSDLVSNFASGIQSAAGAVQSAASHIASIISSLLHHSVPDEGPLMHDDEWGGDLVDNIVRGIRSRTPDVGKAALGVAREVQRGIAGGDYGFTLQGTAQVDTSALLGLDRAVTARMGVSYAPPAPAAHGIDYGKLAAAMAGAMGAVSLNVDSRQLSSATFSARNRVDGSRMALMARGVDA